MSVPKPARDGLYHPRDEDEVRELVRLALREEKVIRVRGSEHSWDPAIYTHPEPSHRRRGINVYLGHLRATTFDDARMEVTVQAGCNLGYDRHAPGRGSTRDNGLFTQLRRRGWALPNTGGISHQTVGGFLSTGSAGGSIRFGLEESVVRLRLVDGRGEIREASAEEDPDLFHAAGVSMGLLGIITAVTFRCVPAYHVIGEESIRREDGGDIDFFGDGGEDRMSLETFFRVTDYSRLFWWPQKGVRKMVVWRARRMTPADYTGETGTPEAFRPKPYEAFEEVLGSRTVSQKLASGVYHLLRRWNIQGPLGAVKRAVLAPVLPRVMAAFIKPDGPDGPQRFWDAWNDALPMDNAVDTRLLPTEFTEMWIPLSRTREVMQVLRDHYEAGGFAATGPYTCEIYPTRSSRFWLSPAYGEDVVKVDIFWFARNSGDPARSYYPQFWNLLERFGFRFHWGKILSGGEGTGPDYLRARYPRWDDFMRVREACDPHQVFVSDYWRRHLAIPAPGLRVSVSGAAAPAPS